MTIEVLPLPLPTFTETDWPLLLVRVARPVQPLPLKEHERVQVSVHVKGSVARESDILGERERRDESRDR